MAHEFMCKFELWRVATRSCPSTWCTCYCKSSFSFLKTSGVSRFLERFQWLGNWWSQNGVQMDCSEFCDHKKRLCWPNSMTLTNFKQRYEKYRIFVGGLSLYLESSSNRLPILRCQIVANLSIPSIPASQQPTLKSAAGKLPNPSIPSGCFNHF